MVTKKATESKQSKTASSSQANHAKSEKAPETKNNSEALEDLDSLSGALEDNLSDLDPDSVVKLIDHWQGLIQRSKNPELKEIAASLKDLQKLLKHENPSGHSVGELLSHMGEQTGEAASKADQGFKAPLQHLGKQLTKVGRSLAKEENQEQIEALNALAETLDQGPDEIGSKSVGEIDRWYDLLHESEDENLQEIATELKALKQLLKGKKVDAGDLSEMLINIGEQTTEAGSNASRGFKGVVQMLGKSLIRLGKAIE
jgi:hypothetical protein